MAIALQAAALIRHAPSAVANAFCVSRIQGAGGRAFGALPEAADMQAILERARPNA